MKLSMQFPGQGIVPGPRTRSLWEAPAARAVWAEADEVLGEPTSEWASQDLGRDTRRGQLVSVIGSLATFATWLDRVGVLPSVVLGHSVGQIAAVGIAAGLPTEQTLRLAAIRAEAMQRVVDTAPPMAMAALIDPPRDLEAVVADVDDVWIANRNGPTQVVVSGSAAAVDALSARVATRVVRLAVPAACHTPLMADAAAEFAERAAAVRLDLTPGATVISNVTAAPLDWTSLLDELTRQIEAPVLWEGSVRAAAELGAQVVIDASPNGVVGRMASAEGTRTLPVAGPEELETAAVDLLHLAEAETHYDLPARALGAIVSTRNRNEDDADYRATVLPAYQAIRAMVGKPTDLDSLIVHLTAALEGKRVDAAELARHVGALRWRSRWA
ncbi:ACP S-malonyltransferase [Curtobacterium sp. ISL-83]|uniref:ACP S-malonyltransferase n=1 Tax=Curtobacterium sp. ISL-83 TaxID=2819145 RepID=UPI001BECC248|nr:ACP S-malonyltransferase [Curtobacterium sp. ISL-83]MBT2502185.1 ACP S-malonyltransferase [Curtobacterium sp. ISL-83]